MSRNYFNQPFWGNEWNGLFDDYMGGMNSFSPFFHRKPSKAEQWQKAMELWWNNMNFKMPEDVMPTVDRIMDQSRMFYMLGQQFSEMLEHVSAAEKGSRDFMQPLVGQIENMKSILEASQSYSHQSISDLFDAWQVKDPWTEFFSNVPGVDKDILGALKADDLDAFMDKYMNTPGVGYAREFQEKLQKNIVLLKRFMKSSEEYNEAMGRVGTKGLDGLKDRIMELTKEGQEITSLRQLYNLWVDCNEDAYADFVFSREYSELYGDLVNSMSAWKKQSNEIRDEILQSQNLPARSDLEAMQKQTAVLVKKLNKLMAKNRNDELRIEELEAQISELKSNLNPDTPAMSRRTTSGSLAKTGTDKADKKSSKTTKKKKTSAKKSVRKKAKAKKAPASGKVVEISRPKDTNAKEADKSKSGKTAGKETVEIKF